MIHLHLKNGKIWIEEDWTEDGVATDLLQAGVPRDDIVARVSSSAFAAVHRVCFCLKR